MNIILVASKNRAEDNYLFNQIKENNLDYKVFVEPQDYDNYLEYHDKDNLVTLKKNDMGLAYARNVQLDWAIYHNVSNYWNIDDDIKNFYHREDTKMVKDDIFVLEKTEKQFFDTNYGIFSLEYQQFAWSAKRSFVLNSYMDTCVNINADLAKKYNIKYKEIAFKSDRDIVMQFIQKGVDTARTSLYAFSCPKNGSNKGGLYNTYNYNEGEKEKDAVFKLIEYWGNDIVRHIVKPDGRNDEKIYWKKIRDKQETLF